jgi:hypothetical protein
MLVRGRSDALTQPPSRTAQKHDNGHRFRCGGVFSQVSCQTNHAGLSDAVYWASRAWPPHDLVEDCLRHSAGQRASPR